MPLTALIIITIVSIYVSIVILTDPYPKHKYTKRIIILPISLILWIIIAFSQYYPIIKSEKEYPVIVKNNIAYVYYNDEFVNISKELKRNLEENEIIIVKETSSG